MVGQLGFTTRVIRLSWPMEEIQLADWDVNGEFIFHGKKLDTIILGEKPPSKRCLQVSSIFIFGIVWIFLVISPEFYLLLLYSYLCISNWMYLSQNRLFAKVPIVEKKATKVAT